MASSDFSKGVASSLAALGIIAQALEGLGSGSPTADRAVDESVGAWSASLASVAERPQGPPPSLSTVQHKSPPHSSVGTGCSSSLTLSSPGSAGQSRDAVDRSQTLRTATERPVPSRGGSSSTRTRTDLPPKVATAVDIHRGLQRAAKDEGLRFVATEVDSELREGRRTCGRSICVEDGLTDHRYRPFGLPERETASILGRVFDAFVFEHLDEVTDHLHLDLKNRRDVERLYQAAISKGLVGLQSGVAFATYCLLKGAAEVPPALVCAAREGMEPLEKHGEPLMSAALTWDKAVEAASAEETLSLCGEPKSRSVNSRDIAKRLPMEMVRGWMVSLADCICRLREGDADAAGEFAALGRQRVCNGASWLSIYSESGKFAFMGDAMQRVRDELKSGASLDGKFDPFRKIDRDIARYIDDYYTGETPCIEITAAAAETWIENRLDRFPLPDNLEEAEPVELVRASIDAARRASRGLGPPDAFLEESYAIVKEANSGLAPTDSTADVFVAKLFVMFDKLAKIRKGGSTAAQIREWRRATAAMVRDCRRRDIFATAVEVLGSCLPLGISTR
eukprot:Polyplicarium_translucidae@DN4829_c0_g1_i1.p1